MARGSARRRNAIRIGALIGAAALGSAGLGIAMGNGDDGAGSSSATAGATLLDASGKTVGRIRFREVRDDALLVRVSAAGLTPGFHGFHVHETGTCVAPFTGAGGHHNPTAQAHGAHAGDMPPLLAGEDGRVRAAFTTTSLTLDGLLDAGGDGSAVIIHAGSDNLANIPSHYHSHVPDATSTTFGPDAATKATGDAGARVACGVVRGAQTSR
jgi:superoxide dismutase, Cu-Zn family